MNVKYTKRQGQYLAFIYYYTKIHGCAPSEVDMQKYFKVSWASIHQMVVTLEKKSLISKIPGKARSIQILVPRDELPDLE
ncbi:MAG: LexA family protein [bacterium]